MLDWEEYEEDVFVNIDPSLIPSLDEVENAINLINEAKGNDEEARQG